MGLWTWQSNENAQIWAYPCRKQVNRCEKLHGLFLFVEVCFNKAASADPSSWKDYSLCGIEMELNKRWFQCYNSLNMYVPPCSTPQSHAISRMFLLGIVVIHRLHHFFMSKADVEQGYLSLNHFCKAASLRSSFHETLLKIVLSIKQRSSLTLVSSSFISKTNGIQTRKKDTRTKEVAWGAISEGVTPKKFVNEWYKKPPKVPAEVAVHNRMRACTGVPLSRVSVATKSRTDAGSRGSCAECGMLTNNFCITCKKWLCDQQLPANRSANNNCFDDDPRYIKITFDDGILGGLPKTICGIFSC